MTRDWTGFLAAALRLVDLHDSARRPGGAPTAPGEQRTGLRDGLWLDLAVQLLSWLDEVDRESNEGWNPLGSFYREAQARHAGLSDDDVQLVVLTLSTPTEMHYLSQAAGKEASAPRLASSKDTALIERRALRGQTDACRLTSRGRLAISLARASHTWLYAHHDADKLGTALTYGEFQDLAPQCAALGQSIRAFAHEITRVLEQPGRQALGAHFMQRGSQYLDTIRRVQTAVRNAREQLSTADTRERFNQWLEQRGDANLNTGNGFDLGVLRRTLDELMQAVERLSRRFSTFLHQVTDSRREVVGAIPFDRLALAFAIEPPAMGTVDLLTASLGPWLPRLCMAMPGDMQGILRAEVDRHQALRPRLFGEQAEAQREQTLMELFVEQHRGAMLAALRHGPVGLGDALQRGWLRVGEHQRLTELVGVYSSPTWLGASAEQVLGAGELRLSIKPGALNARIDADADADVHACAWLAGDDIHMQWVPEQGLEREQSHGSQ